MEQRCERQGHACRFRGTPTRSCECFLYHHEVRGTARTNSGEISDTVWGGLGRSGASPKDNSDASASIFGTRRAPKSFAAISPCLAPSAVGVTPNHSAAQVSRHVGVCDDVLDECVTIAFMSRSCVTATGASMNVSTSSESPRSSGHMSGVRSGEKASKRSIQRYTDSTRAPCTTNEVDD